MQYHLKDAVFMTKIMITRSVNIEHWTLTTVPSLARSNKTISNIHSHNATQCSGKVFILKSKISFMVIFHWFFRYMMVRKLSHQIRDRLKNEQIVWDSTDHWLFDLGWLGYPCKSLTSRVDEGKELFYPFIQTEIIIAKFKFTTFSLFFLYDNLLYTGPEKPRSPSKIWKSNSFMSSFSRHFFMASMHPYACVRVW